MKENNVQLFVYGSLRSGFKSDAYQYISKYFKLIGAATAKGLLYDMGTYPVATPTIEEHFIVGELYEIIDKNAFDFVIAQLDDYEGLVQEEDEETLYIRTLTDVYVNDKIHSKAYVYWFCGDIKFKQVITSGDVLAYFEQKKKGL